MKRLYQGGSVSREDYRGLVLLVALGALLAILLAYPGVGLVRTPDSHRFQNQAQSLLEGRGLSTYGGADTVLPPGYPILLAIMLSVNAEKALLGTQIAFFLGAIFLVFVAVYHLRSVRVAGYVAGLLAINLWVARTCFYMLSESLGILLSAALVFLSIRGSSIQQRSLMALLGALLVILPLTSPATQPLCFLLAVALLIGNLSRRNLVWLLGGAALPFVFWQWYCVSSAGRLGIPLYTANIAVRGLSTASGNEDPLIFWFRGWATSEADLWWVWHPEEAASLPARAFRSEEEQRKVVTALSRLRDGGVAQQESERTLELVGRSREADDWFQYHIVLPLIRAKSLWLRMPQIGHIQKEYVLRLGVGRFLRDRQDVGASRAVARILKGVVSSFGYVLWLMIPVLFVLACFFPPPERAALLAAIVAGVFLYTAVSAYGGLGEGRRNLVFYPVMLWVIAASRLFETVLLVAAQIPRLLERAIGRR